MRILAVELDNVKSYKHARIEFADGTNAISGHNGAGKSTILEAIGFVLFDYLQTSQADFVRQGEKEATVLVTVENHGHVYDVVRVCGSASKYFVLDNGMQITTGKGDTVDWLHKFLGIPKTEELPTIFRDAVGVPQGLLTAAFLESPANRKRIFAPLLRVDEYEIAWEKLRDSEGIVKRDIQAEERTRAVLEAETAELPRFEQEHADLQVVVTNDTDAIEMSRALLQVNKGRWDELDDAKTRLGAVEATLALLHSEQASALNLVHAAQDQVDSAKKADSIVQECVSGYQEHLVAQERLGYIAAELKEKNKLSLAITEAKGALASANDRMDSLGRDLAASVAAQLTAEALIPKAEQQAQLTKRAEALRLELRLADADSAQIRREEERLEALRKRLADAQAMVEKGVALATQIEEENARSESLQAQEDEIRQKGLETKAEIGRLEKQIESLSGDLSQCPVCGTELTPDHVENLKSIAESSLIVLRAYKETLNADWTTTHNQNKDLQVHISLHRQVLAAYQALDPDAIQTEVIKQEGHVASLGTPRSSTEIQTELDAINADIAVLGDSSRALAVAQSRAAKRQETEGAIAETEHSLMGLLSKLDSLDAEMLPYADLEQRQEEAEALRQRTLDAHNRYVNYSFEAKDLPKREALLAQRQWELREKEVQIAENQAVRDVLVALYNADEYRTLSATIHEMELGISSMSARVDLNRRILETQAQDIAKMRQKLVELERSIHIHEHLQTVLSRIAFVRQVVRDAGPEITKMVSASVSITAEGIFQGITQDPSSRLTWDETYDIIVETDGQTRHFNQLSGGEQMAAALSVRLALLKEISSIDFGAFDEPTVNLDTTRRTNLSEQIINVKGFTQLFVISHDDSFESSADNTVRIEKVNGESVVVS